ncbi:ribonuclease H1 [Elysia marginata]|uniref:ribonuclease H n=1 Tax=Elysia marginata TaxID=1093978 RepID=A0AAV4EU07_9GAST|nr:ribonuclease H1 [Elysia marginata]
MPKSKSGACWFYAVRHGRVPGIYHTWPECESQVKGFCKPSFKKFATFQEAQDFISDGGTPPKLSPNHFNFNRSNSAPVPFKSAKKVTSGFSITSSGFSQSSTSPVSSENSASTYSPHKISPNFQNFIGSKFESSKNVTSSVSVTPLIPNQTSTSPVSSQTLTPMVSSHTITPPASSQTSMCNSQGDTRVTLSSLNSEVTKVHSTLNRLIDVVQVLSSEVGCIRSSVDRIETAAFIAPGTKRNFSTMAREPDDIGNAKQPKKEKSGVGGFTGSSFDEADGVHVYTDGGCFDNGRTGARAGIGVYWGRDDLNNVSEALSGRPSNNRAEIHAAVRAVQIAKRKGIKNLIVHTDSQFLINGITKWIHRWKKNGWKLSTGHPVINKEDFSALDNELNGISVKWVYVKGHSGHAANEEADRLAKQGAEKAEVL